MVKVQYPEEFTRDGRAPVPESLAISHVMSANKGKDTKPELLLRKTLWRMGQRGYRLHWKKVPGKPDIAYPAKRLAIFVNGCYWHRCPHCDMPLPKSNMEFWKKKFERNVERDKKKTRELINIGWNVLTVWECQIYDDLYGVVENIRMEWNKN